MFRPCLWKVFLAVALPCWLAPSPVFATDTPLRIATFEADITPPLGAPYVMRWSCRPRKLSIPSAHAASFCFPAKGR